MEKATFGGAVSTALQMSVYKDGLGGKCLAAHRGPFRCSAVIGHWSGSRISADIVGKRAAIADCHF